MKCYNHKEKDADRVCSKCGKGICEQCAQEYNGKLLCNSCFGEEHKITTPIVEIIDPNKKPVNTHPAFDYILLIAALFIDLMNMWPADLDFIGIGFLLELPFGLIQAAFLTFLGVPLAKSALQTTTEFLPIVDLIPWCVMAVLYKRFNFNNELFRWLFN